MSGKVPPSSRVKRGGDLREKFTGHKTRCGPIVDVPDLPDEVFDMGTLDAVCYTTVRDGRTEKYIHEFAKRDRPRLCVSPDGAQIIIVGGAYDWTERGFVDASDHKTRREMGID